GTLLAPDGNFLATWGTSFSDAVRLWDVAGRREIEPADNKVRAVVAVAFSADSRRAGAGGGCGEGRGSGGGAPRRAGGLPRAPAGPGRRLLRRRPHRRRRRRGPARRPVRGCHRPAAGGVPGPPGVHWLDRMRPGGVGRPVRRLQLRPRSVALVGGAVGPP